MSQLIERIKKRVWLGRNSLPYPPATFQQINDAEERLGFPIPAILKQCYLEIGNGGIDESGSGLIGLDGGFTEIYGSLVDIYQDDLERPEWRRGLLAFWAWGATIYSCVDCLDPDLRIATLEEGKIYPQTYTLNEFFEMWAEGVNILNVEGVTFEKVEIMNPFTQKKATISIRKRLQ